VRFRILGPIRVGAAGREVTIAGRDGILLGMLLLYANQPVTTDRLIDAIWPANPPRNARNQLQGCVSRLRKRLSDAGISGQVIVTELAGYRATADPDDLDLLAFRRLAAKARADAGRGRHDEARAGFRAALDLWHGPALAGVNSLAVGLEEERAQVTEACLEVELAAGGGSELVAESTDLVRQHPHREGLHRVLMLALYRAGRQADALAAYRHARQLLHDELGIEPGSELQQLHQAILNRDPALDVRSPAAAPTLRQLPSDVAGFTGRAEALKALNELLNHGDPPGPVVISAIAGTAGVGKTALAVHWAHKVADQFPDGQLYVNLRGFDPAGLVLPPAEAVRRFLDALGVPAERVPADLDTQAALYRSLVAGKRMLVVLDNARDAEQVRPLLPGSSTVAVVVTSRNRLTPLLVSEGARPLQLDLLSTQEARELLAARLGGERVAAEPEATEAIIAACARLPLALAIAAARAQQSGFTLRAVADELADAGQRLDALDAGDPASQIRSVLSWSYDALSPPSATLFRLLGLHPGPDISAAAAASLAGHPPVQTRRLLTELTNAGLIAEHRPGRYTWHDLLRAYAAELAAEDPEPARSAALTRLLDHYTHTAHAAALLLAPARGTIPLDPPQPRTTAECPTDDQQALAWFTAEHFVLLAAVDHAAATGFDTHCWQLAWTLCDFLDRRGHWHDLATTQHTAVAAAGRLNDPIAQACTHRLLASAYTRLGRFDDANTQLRHVLNLTTQTGDLAGQAQTHHNLSHLWGRRGRHREALDHARQALDLFRAAGHRHGQARALNAIGWEHVLLGDHRQALAYCLQALPLFQDLGDRFGHANTWDSLGYAHHHLGDHTEAITCYQRALKLYRDLGHRYYEADTLTHLGDTQHAAGNLHATQTAWKQALAILDDLDHPDADKVQTKLHALQQVENAPGPRRGSPRPQP
jgi:DNA-binding SARP family transcriptional activator/Tfp pilus assembly protein PilF